MSTDMFTSRVTYVYPIGTENKHLKSGKSFITDAPVDNNGKGAAFSPTDTLSTALAACMLTIMGIVADQNGFEFTEAHVDVKKHMLSNPRRVGKIEITMKVKDAGYSQKQKEMLEGGALNCPVAKSLHPDLIQEVEFSYY